MGIGAVGAGAIFVQRFRRRTRAHDRWQKGLAVANDCQIARAGEKAGGGRHWQPLGLDTGQKL